MMEAMAGELNAHGTDTNVLKSQFISRGCAEKCCDDIVMFQSGWLVTCVGHLGLGRPMIMLTELNCRAYKLSYRDQPCYGFNTNLKPIDLIGDKKFD